MSAASDTSFRDVLGLLESRHVECALIGGHAVSLHGAPRATVDTDLLVADAVCLTADFWTRLVDAGHVVDVRLGDADDPLRGVVRIGAAGEDEIDIVVPRGTWSADVVRRAVATELRGVRVRVATAADLVLLKLYAGGPNDLRDIRSLLDTPAGPAIREETAARIGSLPRFAREAWSMLLAE